MYQLQQNLFLHELFFYGLKDHPLNVLDDYTLYKETLFLYEVWLLTGLTQILKLAYMVKLKLLFVDCDLLGLLHYGRDLLLYLLTLGFLVDLVDRLGAGIFSPFDPGVLA